MMAITTEQGMTSAVMPIRVAVMRAMVIPSTVMLDPVVSTLVQPVMLQAGMRMMLWRTVVTAM